MESTTVHTELECEPRAPLPGVRGVGVRPHNIHKQATKPRDADFLVHKGCHNYMEAGEVRETERGCSTAVL